MFFKKGKKSVNEEITEPVSSGINTEETIEDAHLAEEPQTKAEPKPSYSFYKPEPYPKDLVSVLGKMLQRLFPDTRKAYLLEAKQDNKKGYLLIVDIDSKFLKIINIYLDSETKRVRGNTPIECVLYSKSGAITEGIEPFYVKENAASNSNNLASKEFSGEIVFSDMPEFELWSHSETKNDVSSSKKEVLTDNETMSGDQKEADTEKPTEDVPETAPQSEVTSTEPDKKKVTAPPVKKETEHQTTVPEPKTTPVKEEKPQTKVKPTTKQELFGLLNQYGAKKSGTVSTVAMAAIREYEFYIPYSYANCAFSDKIENSLTIDETLRFKKLINPSDEKKAVPLFTQKEDAISFAKKEDCRIAYIKYKDFASSMAAELTGYDGIIINPDDEGIFLLSTHPLLG